MEAEVVVVVVGCGGWGVHGAVGGQGVELAVAGVTEEPSRRDGEGADLDGAECCVRRLSWFQSQVWTVEEDRGDRD